MDEVIEVTSADKGFLILMESDELRVKVARNLNRENIADAVEQLSDSIIAKVVQHQKPLIISDAINDEEFKASESVVNLKVLSVMCVPLLERGNLLGAHLRRQRHGRATCSSRRSLERADRLRGAGVAASCATRCW